MEEAPKKIKTSPVHNKPQEGFNVDDLFRFAEIISQNPKKSELVDKKVITAFQLASLEEGTSVPDPSKLPRIAEVLGIELSVLQEALNLYHKAVDLEKKKKPIEKKPKIATKDGDHAGGSTGRRSGFRHIN